MEAEASRQLQAGSIIPVPQSAGADLRKPALPRRKKMKKLLLIILIALLSTAAVANDPKKKYGDQRKYQKMFCVIAGIPINLCKGKKRP